jgi:preprotein translocase subunit SecG
MALGNSYELDLYLYKNVLLELIMETRFYKHIHTFTHITIIIYFISTILLHYFNNTKHICQE